MKILVIDDNPVHRQSAHDQLTPLGHELTIVDRFYAGEEAIKNNHYDVVMTDMLMPEEQVVDTYFSPFDPRPKHEKISYEAVPNTEVPYGMFMVFLAATYGFKHIVLLSLGNHHDNRMISALARATRKDLQDVEIFTLNGSKVYLSHNPHGDQKKWDVALERLMSSPVS